MSVEPIGLLALTVGLMCMATGYHAVVVTFVLACLLGSSAALFLGSGNVQPAHMLLAFLAASVLPYRKQSMAFWSTFKYGKPAFWLLCFVAYGVLTAVLLPRMLAGQTSIVPIGTSAYGETNGTVPLGPVSGNITQPLYLLGDLACFALISSVASTKFGFRTLAFALTLFGIANIGFALLDVLTYSTGTAWAMSFIRNAKYTLHLEEEVSGIKRIAGSYTEASTFASVTIAIFSYTATLWIGHNRSALNGALALVSFFLVLASTSSTGLVGLVVVLGLLSLTAIATHRRRLQRRNATLFLIIVPVTASVIFFGIYLSSSTYQIIAEYLNTLLFQKAQSQSGLERASWNQAAVENFLQSYGLGVGLGTARASSFALALLSNVGIPGTILFLLFLYNCFPQISAKKQSPQDHIRRAAKNGFMGIFLGSLVSGSQVDLGLLFFIFASLASSGQSAEEVITQSIEKTLSWSYHE